MEGIRTGRRYVLPEATVVFTRHARAQCAFRSVFRGRQHHIAEALARQYAQHQGLCNLIVCDVYEVAAEFLPGRKIVVVTVIYVGSYRRRKVEI